MCAERTSSTGRPKQSERAGQNERTERADHTKRPERAEPPGRTERTERADHTKQLELRYRLVPDLADFGNQSHLEGVLQEQSLHKGAMELRLPEGINYNLELNNTGSGILLQGRAIAHALTECSRCLADAALDIDAEVEAYYVLRPRDAELASGDEDIQLVGNDGYVDLALPIRAAMIYELPFTVLCRDDCAGVCPHCGANLNEESCTCGDKVDPNHPLAVLTQLFSDGESRIDI